MGDKAKSGKVHGGHGEIGALLRLPPGPVRIADLDPDATPGFPG